jgi:hypothetical protein
METEIRKTEEKDGVTREICVRKAENGYIVNVESYGYRPRKKETNSEEKEELAESGPIKDDREYFNESKSYVSKTNPLEDSEKPLKDQIANALKTMKI